MAADGIVMGAHTRTHPILSQVTGDRIGEEIAGSRDDLARRLEGPVEWFAYPQGGPADFNDDNTIDVTDPISMLSYNFIGGAPPAAPGPHVCGEDPTPDGLPECDYKACF